MAAVPQKTLNWLYDVLRREYRDPNRTYSDLAQTLAQYSGFAPRTEVYTAENGVPALLVNLKGTVPVTFRGTVYRFPIAIWVPHNYPYEAPIVFVTPTEDMVVRQGQHVSGADGKVYHHYLTQWGQSWDRSNVVEFLKTLADVFAREPPVMARQQTGTMQQPPRNQGPPLPNPPQRYPGQMGPSPGQYGPPRPPPKQPVGEDTSRPGSIAPPSPVARPGRYDAPPPLPPPGQSSGSSIRPQSGHANGHVQQPPGGLQYMPQRQGSQNQPIQASQQIPQQYRGQSPSGPQSSPAPQPRPPQAQGYSQPVPGQPQPSYGYQAQHQQPPPPGQQPQVPYQQQPPQQYPQPYTQLPSQQRPSVQPQLQSQPPIQQKPPPPKDLLSEEDPFQLALPTTSAQRQSIPAPPIPTNPEKEALLSHLSRQILQHLHQSISQTSTTALPSLQSQHNALISAQQVLKSELQSLQTLSSQLNSNISSLQSTLTSANNVISSTSSPTSSSNPKNIPVIDEIIIPPSVIARQLYDNVAEQRGYEAAIYALNEAFVRGRIGSEIWGRKCREVAREEFRRKWMVRRIGRGLGLEGA